MRFLGIAAPLEHTIAGEQHRSVWPGLIGPATCYDGMYLSDALRWVFQHVGISAPYFGISLLFIVRFSNGLDHCEGHLIGFHLMHSLKFSVRYF